ncbi:MAG: hypothetical protein ACOX2F_02465 [bacterium]
MNNFLIGKKMKLFARLLSIVLVISFVTPAYAQDQVPQTGINLKVGESFYFEGNIKDKAADEGEESMAEIQKTPFYKSTWFITVVSAVVIAGAAVGIYYGTRTSEPEGNIVEWK